MRPWEASSAHEADDIDYEGLIDALKPDQGLLNQHYWRRDLKKQYGDELDDENLDRHAGLASAVLGTHPTTQVVLRHAGGSTRSPADLFDRHSEADFRDSSQSHLNGSSPNKVPGNPYAAAFQEPNSLGGLGPFRQGGLVQKTGVNLLDPLVPAEEIRDDSSRQLLHAWPAAGYGTPSPSEIQTGSEEARRMSHPGASLNPPTEFMRNIGPAFSRAVGAWVADLRRPDGFENLDPEVRKILEDARATTQAEIDAVLDHWPGGKAVKAARIAVTRGPGKDPASGRNAGKTKGILVVHRTWNL